MKNQSSFKKSILSVVVLSAVTASFISWDKYQPRHETPSLTEFYQSGESNQNDVLLQSMVTNDSASLARIAEDNLMLEAELIAASITESSYSSEADEGFDYHADTEQVVLLQEVQPEVINPAASEATLANNHQVIIANKVLFGFDSSEITEDNYVSLNETAHQMQSLSEESVWQVVGYADRSGNFIYNSKLARKRAQAVAEYLVNKGVNEDQLAVISLGTSNPEHETRSVANNRNERRVEIHAYQAEVTALLEQYNQQLKQSQQPAIKPTTAPINEPAVVDVDKKDAVNPAQGFEAQTIGSLTTAMEF